MNYRDSFETNAQPLEEDAPFDSVAALCDFIEEQDGPNVFRDIYDAKERWDAAAA